MQCTMRRSGDWWRSNCVLATGRLGALAFHPHPSTAWSIAAYSLRPAVAASSSTAALRFGFTDVARFPEGGGAAAKPSVRGGGWGRAICCAGASSPPTMPSCGFVGAVGVSPFTSRARADRFRTCVVAEPALAPGRVPPALLVHGASAAVGVRETSRGCDAPPVRTCRRVRDDVGGGTKSGSG